MSKVHWLAISAVPGIGGATARRLVERFGSVEALFDAPDEELVQVPRVTAEAVAALKGLSLNALEADLMALADEGIQVLTWGDAEYPANLREVNDAPPLLFIYGSIIPEDRRAVAIVGTRRPADRAAEVAEELACRLAALGMTIVSGLAAGIDTSAHKGALRTADGRTLAVLGSGVRVIHPRDNARLAEEIARRGALLSEFFPNAPPQGQSLMARDRIVSGLSRAVIVVEAGEKSGTLDTARKARNQKRLVFAVPGSPGTDDLLSRRHAERLDPESLDIEKLVRRIAEFRAEQNGQLSLLS